VSAHTLKPLDIAGLKNILREFETVIVVEEHSERAGLGAQTKEIAWDIDARCSLHTFALKDEFIHIYGSQGDLWRAHGLTADAIVTRVRARVPVGR
jgi:transketolase